MMERVDSERVRQLVELVRAGLRHEEHLEVVLLNIEAEATLLMYAVNALGERHLLTPALDDLGDDTLGVAKAVVTEIGGTLHIADGYANSDFSHRSLRRAGALPSSVGGVPQHLRSVEAIAARLHESLTGSMLGSFHAPFTRHLQALRDQYEIDGFSLTVDETEKVLEIVQHIRHHLERRLPLSFVLTAITVAAYVGVLLLDVGLVGATAIMAIGALCVSTWNGATFHTRRDWQIADSLCARLSASLADKHRLRPP